MEVELHKLLGFTVFKYGGRTYRKTGSTWIAQAVKNQGKHYHGPQNPDAPVVSCEPKLGGEFQSQLCEWFNLSTIVEVN